MSDELMGRIATGRMKQLKLALFLIDEGIDIIDPNRFDCRGELMCDPGVTIDIGCIFEGRVVIGRGTKIGPYCVIKNAVIGENTVIQPFTHIDGAIVGDTCQVGPFARLRPGADLSDDVHIGNFVEVKNSAMMMGSKANHLAYIGDASVGPRVNIGAGAITANYDGANKHKTVIGADAHVGSNSVLVAPVHVPNGATVGAGSTVGGQVGDGLTFTRAQAVNRPNWTRPEKAKK